MRRLHYISIFLILSMSSCFEVPTDWSMYYESQYTKPYGTKVFVEELENIVPDGYVETLKGKTDVYFEEYTGDSASTYFYINTNFYPDHNQITNMLEHTCYGNSLFFATDNPNADIYTMYNVQLKSIDTNDFQLELTHLNGDNKYFNFKSRTSKAFYFDTIPQNAKVLGNIKVDDEWFANYISLDVQHGNGKIFLHANPELFSNYHLLKESDGKYAFGTMSYLRDKDCFIWDGFGTKRRYTQKANEGDITGLLRYIRKNKSLFFGFLTIVGAILLLVIFNYKRIVRPLPIYTTQKNNSIEFMKMVSNLFESEANHADLAKYRLIFILDKIKSKYHLDTSVLDDNFSKKLSEKAAISIQDASKLVTQLTKIKESKNITKESFLIINKYLEPIVNKLNIY